MGFFGLSPSSTDAEVLRQKKMAEMVFGDSNFLRGSCCILELLSGDEVFGNEKADSNNYTNVYMKMNKYYFPSTRMRARYGVPGK